MTSSSSGRTLVFASVILLAGLIVGCAVVLRSDIFYEPSPTAALESLSVCFKKSVPEYKTNTECLREKVPNLVRKYRTQDLMHAVYADPRSVVGINCHVIGHYIGGSTFDKSTSLEDALSQCTRDCRFACVHGAVGSAVLDELGESYEEDVAHADAATLEQIGEKYCKQSSSLCHGIGHILLIATRDYDEALRVCDTVSVERQACYLGVFMEGANSIETNRTGRETLEASTTNYAQPCTSIKTKYRRACFLDLPVFQNKLFEADSVDTYTEQLTIARRTCEALPQNDRLLCFFGMGNYAYRIRDERDRRVDTDSYCDQFTTRADRGACMIGIVRSYMFAAPPQYDEALSYCMDRAPKLESETCLNAAFRFLRADSANATLCPDSSKTACMETAARYERGQFSAATYFTTIFPR